MAGVASFARWDTHIVRGLPGFWAFCLASGWLKPFSSQIYIHIKYILWSWCRPPVLYISPKTGTVGVPCHGLCWIWMIYNRKTVRCRRPPGTCDMVTIVTATKSIRKCIYAKIYGMCSAAWVLMKREYAIMDWLTDCWTEVIARGKDWMWKG